ncbi:MAG: spermine/spermidine synthase domain-containing protein [Candidatus Anammoxibacter sp.]
MINYLLLLSVISLGITSAMTQFVMMREFLAVFSQNELILGLILGSWTVLTGFGAFLGRFFAWSSKSTKFFSLLFLALATLPIIQFGLIRSLRSFFVSGVEIGPHEIFISCFLFMAPFCLFSGLLLNLLSEGFILLKGGEKTGRVYLWEALGDIIGGVLFSFIFVYFLSSFETLLFIFILNLLLMGISLKGIRRIIVISILSVSIIVFFKFDIEKELLKMEFKGQEILHHESNPYGKLTVTKKDDQINFFENGKLFSSDRETISKEEGIHYGMSQVSTPESVLLIGGAFEGVIGEILKYKSIKRVDYIEKNPWLMELFKGFFAVSDSEVLSLIIEDPAVFIRLKDNAYDAILVNLPPPTTASLNRFYTVEFFNDIKGALKKNGVFSFSLPGSSNYFGERLSFLTSSVYQTLKTVFPNIMIVPGGNNYFIASLQPLNENISQLIESKNIVTRYTNAKYLRGILTKDRIEAVGKIVKKEVSINHDFRPSAYFIYLRYWFAKFDKGFLLPLLFVTFTILVSLMLFKGIGEYALIGAIYTSGFSGMGLQVILLMAFQISHGYLYNYLSVMITAFFIGGFIGAALFSKIGFQEKRHFLFLESMLVLLCFATPVIFLSTTMPPFIFTLFNLFAGFIVGAEFIFVSNFFKKEDAKNVSAYLFVFDFLGSSLGAFVIGSFVIPWVGVKESCFILGIIKVFSFSLVYLKDWRRNRFGIYERFPQLFLFVAVSFIYITMGIMIYFEETGMILYGYSLSPIYIYLILILFGVGLFIAMEYRLVLKKPDRYLLAISRLTGVTPFRIFNFIVFSLVAFFPIFRCYFTVPYVFCHVCPRKCVFGVIRPYFIPAALLMNLGRNTWCFHFCPIGTLQDTEYAAFKTRSIAIPRISSLVSFFMFAAICYFYFKTEIDFNAVTSKGEDWHTFFFKNRYTCSLIVIVSSLAILGLSLIVRRSFCKLFCPVNFVSEVRLRIEKIFFKKEEKEVIYE